MKIQLDWLKEYVDFDVSTEKLGQLLTMAGLEIEAQETVKLGDGTKTEVLELNVTPNRGYCLSYFGVAREVAALMNKNYKYPDYESELKKNWGPNLVEEKLTVDNRAPELCLRYSGMVIEDVKIGPSPKWLVDRLTAIGLRSVNNIVDITNFVLMEYGQPLHAFDKDLLDGSEIIVRHAAKNEAFTSLDGIELKLDEDTLVIADTSKAIALAGIMGGANSQVKETTRNIILESASFDSVIVRKGSKKYGLRSDSSIRFERGVDIKGVIAAQTRAALLIKKLAGGIISKGRVDVCPLPLPNKVIFLRVSRLNEVLGCSLSVDHIENLLFRLGTKASKQKDCESFSVGIPSFRPFLTREIDLIEEVARLNGFDKIEVTSPSAKISPVRLTSKQLAIRNVKNLLSHTGFSEVLTYSFIGETIAKQFQSAFSRNCEINAIALKNPISSDMAVMRPSLLPGLIHSLIRNFSKGQKHVKIFEFGNVFINSKENRYEERMVFAGLIAGTHGNNVWEQTGSSYDYFDLKGTLDSVTRFLKLNLTEQPRSERPFMLAGKNVRLMANGQDCGYFGGLSSSVVRLYELPRHCIVFELDFDILIHSCSKKASFFPLPKFPETFRDISILIDKTVASGEVMSKISQIGEPLLSKVELYDHFEGKRVQEGKKSLTYALTFQSSERTLVDEEINPIFDKMVKTLWSQFGATLRE